MNNCYVVLKHIPKANDVSNVLSSLLGVASTLYLAELMIVRDLAAGYDTSVGLECYVNPGYSDTRGYYLRGMGAYDDAVSYTVKETAINDDASLL